VLHSWDRLTHITIILQSDGDKKIELKPGFYMEHDKDVTTIPTSTRHLFHMSRMVVGDSVSTASSVCCATPVDLQSAKRRPMCTIFLYTLILDMAKSGVEFEAVLFYSDG
jgi:hypothetical protein